MRIVILLLRILLVPFFLGPRKRPKLKFNINSFLL